MLLQLGSEESPSLCQPTLPRSCLSLKLLYWVKNKRKQTFIFFCGYAAKTARAGLALLSLCQLASPLLRLPIAPLNQSWPAAGPRPALPVPGGSHGDGAPGTCCLSCANNMKAFWGGIS